MSVSADQLRFSGYSADRYNALIDEDLERNWLFSVLSVIPLACVIGNGLVIAAVWSTKSLQTPTNYLLVSLACADLLIGFCVMPLNIYVSVNALHWHLSAELCYVYCVLDVAASTCSIAHLVLISIDRLVAATKPAEYKTQKHKRRVYIAIACTWLFSICISLPLVTGFNTNTRYVLLRKHHCGIYSPMYMLCSSIFAFYMPCLIMSITYGYIFHTLRRRLRAIQLQEMAGGQFLGFGADVGNIATSAIETVIGVEARNRNMISWEKPLLRKIEETAAEHASSLNDSEREQLQTILEAVHPSCSSTNNSQFELTTTFADTDEMSDRPPSVVLDAITLRNNNNSNYAESYSSSLALEVPKCVPGRISMRRFSEAIQSNIHRRNQVSIFIGDSPTSADEDDENNNNSATNNTNNNNIISLRYVNNKNRNDRINSNASHEQPNQQSKQQQRPMRKDSTTPKRLKRPRKVVTIRRHSYQPPGCVPAESANDANEAGGATLKPNLRGKAMRRLSEIISDWERPSRASLGQMYSFARRESVYIARKKLAGLKDWALDLLAKLKSKQGMAIRRETRATKLVATVMGVFLICWMPFFTLNMVKVYRLIHSNWPSDLEFLFHWTSALGYLNSSLNFVIYSAINKKFRSSFRRLIGLSSKRKRKSWMLPPRVGNGVNGGAAENVTRKLVDEARQRQRHRHRRHHHNHNCRHNNGNAFAPKFATTSKPSETPLSAPTAPGDAEKDRLNTIIADGIPITPPASDNCGCISASAFNPARSSRSSRSGKSARSGSSNPILTRRFSIRKPEIIIDEVSAMSDEHVSISAGGRTTYRHSSDDCIRRSSSEMIGGGVTYPSNQHHESRRGSGMSNSSASLQLHDMHQIADQSSHEAEIFV